MGDLIFHPTASRRPTVEATPARARRHGGWMVALELGAIILGAVLWTAGAVVLAFTFLVNPALGFIVVALLLITRPTRRRR